MSTDTGIDLGDLPEIPDAVEGKKIRDGFDYNTAFRFGFVGVGQAGGRIAETFARIGYGRACALNTTIADLSQLNGLSAEQKLDFGGAKGAGKDPAIAAALAQDRGEDFYDFFKRSLGDELDYVFVCFGAAGGTGAGAFPKVAEVLQRLMAETHHPVRVGAIVALPKDAEGQQFAKNALYSMRRLAALSLSPVIFVDNQKIKELYDPISSKEHQIENSSTAQLLHLFNRMAGTDSDHTSFDRADLAKLLDSGIVAFGSTTIKTWANPADISTPIRDQLKRNVLATVDLSAGNLAALIYVLSGAAYDEVKASDLDHATQMLTRILVNGSTVFPGVYKGTGTVASIKALAMIGGLSWPRERLDELSKIAGLNKDEIANALGV